MGLVLVPRQHRVSAHFMVRAVLLLNEDEDRPFSACRPLFESLCVAGGSEPAQRLGGGLGSHMIFQLVV